jgi:hypothetical protein
VRKRKESSAIRRLGNWAIRTAISSTIVHSRQAWTKSSTAKRPSSRRNVIRFRTPGCRPVSSRNMYSEHGFEALMRPEAGQVCQSLMVVSYWMPGSALAQAANGHLVPELPRRHGLRDLPVHAPGQAPVAPVEHGAHELVLHADRVVRVLAGDGDVGLAVPVGRVGRHLEAAVALAGVEDALLDRTLGQQRLARLAHRLLERRVLGGVEPVTAGEGRIVARGHDRVRVPLQEPGAGDQRRHLLLLAHLPADELLDVGMVDVADDHLRARRVVPPDLMAPAARSPILRKLISPDDLPPPESRSFAARRAEKLVPVPEPYLKSRASRTHRSMMPPSPTRSSATDWMKQACGCGRS